MKHIFLDLETTGLDSETDQITEAAWITEDWQERRFFVEHTRLPNRWVLKTTDYLQRIALAPKVPLARVLAILTADCDTETYLVGACPAFDDRFLRVAYESCGIIELPYNYHLIDIEAMTMGALGSDKPCHLKELRGLLGIEGENPAPHTALSDAREVKLIWDRLRWIASRRVSQPSGETDWSSAFTTCPRY